MRYPAELVASLKASLQAMPSPMGELTSRELVEALADEIRELRRKRHSLDKIAENFRERGVTLSAATIRTYLPGGKRRRRGRARPAAQGAEPDTGRSESVGAKPERHPRPGLRVGREAEDSGLELPSVRALQPGPAIVTDVGGKGSAPGHRARGQQRGGPLDQGDGDRQERGLDDEIVAPTARAFPSRLSLEEL